MPSYILQDLDQNKEMFKVINFSNIIHQIKCGRKIGQSLNDLDNKWSEKWYEIKIQDKLNP